jgi:predicted RNase H-like HicB family nuclease
MRYAVIIEHDPETGSYGAYAPDLPGCGAAAETREEVIALIHEAIEFHLEGLQEDGLPVPEATTTVEYVEARSA